MPRSRLFLGTLLIYWLKVRDSTLKAVLKEMQVFFLSIKLYISWTPWQQASRKYDTHMQINGVTFETGMFRLRFIRLLYHPFIGLFDDSSKKARRVLTFTILLHLKAILNFMLNERVQWVAWFGREVLRILVGSHEEKKWLGARRNIFKYRSNKVSKIRIT